MGGSMAAIAQCCEDLRSDHVLMFSLVINPNPDLIALIPSHERERFVRELTEKTVDDFFDARGLDTGCEMSYVLHHRTTDDMQQHNPHTHVVLPGTVWSEESGERIPLYFSRNKKVNHIEMLHEVTEHNMVSFMERYAGRDWEQRIDALEELRQAQMQVIDESNPHGYHITDEGEHVPFWGGVRQVDEAQCAVGYYIPFANEDGEISIQFRKIALGLDVDYADRLSTVVVSRLYEYADMDQITLYEETIRLMLEEAHEDIQSPTVGRSIDIGL
jgi:hypothetical protein